jgi:hypothetical protein
MHRFGTVLLMGLVGLGGCAAQQDEMDEAPAEVVLGPVDGHDLPGTELERVQVGALAPDFALASLAGPVVRLSSFRGAQNVVLVFYRGHW